MARHFLLLLGAFLLAASAKAAEPRSSASADLEFFEKKVRPVLAANCYSCHGSEKQKAGLRLDSRGSMMTGGDSGPVVVPGNPQDSLLVKAINYQAEPQMPPKGKLPDDQIAALTEWIRRGATWPMTETKVRPVTASTPEFKITEKDRAFWSFRPITNPPLPSIRDGSWPKTSIDHFVLAHHEARGLHSVGPADKLTLLRRVTFDLTGLPPTPREIEAFVSDMSPNAFARVVDRLLASPHYGERWARHWLDIARYGEDQAHTFQARKYPYGYRYRDWLIRAFNEDLPYDRFVQEQIAADLLDGPGRIDRLPALGLFALGPVYYGDPKKFDQLDDRIDTLTRGFLGLTVSCARCHDHKFDPLSQRDYYALAGVFAATDYEEVPLVSKEEVAEAEKKLTDEQRKKKVRPNFPMIHALKDAAKPAPMRVLTRGNPDAPGDEVPRRFLEILCPSAPKPFAQGSGRLELAKAIASPDNPLTARVMVNRVWAHHFGRGLVRTTSNFGQLGERPSHPELLDHLATRFVRSGWSLKALHREILLSATYQQSSLGRNSLAEEADADNRLLWRAGRRRLEVEAWRDAMLAAAGTLDRTVGGPSTDLNAADNRRRTLYGSVSRHELNPLLRLFDFPDPNVTSDGRPVTTVPLQQLFVLNSEFMVRNAKALSASLTPAGDDAARVRLAFARLYGRPPTERELKLGLAFLSAPNPPGGLSRWEQYAQVLLSANEFLYVD
jgi:mono/diheme cytochrome c family protein